MESDRINVLTEIYDYISSAADALDQYNIQVEWEDDHISELHQTVHSLQLEVVAQIDQLRLQLGE